MSWIKGKSGNPNGRPAKRKAISEAMREIIEGKSISMVVKYEENDEERTEKIKVSGNKNFAYGVAAMVISKAIKGDVHAARELIDRMEGKPTNDVKLDANVSGIDTSKLTLVEKKQLATLLGRVSASEE